MNYKKIIGLVPIAAIAALALVGPPSALATFETSWCKVREIPCEAGHLYKSGTEHGFYEAKAQNPELLTSLGTIKCQESVLTGTLLNELASPLLAELNSLTFSGCKRNGTENCELKQTALGHALFLRTAGYGGTVVWHNTSVLLKCVGMGIHCVFGGLREFNFTSSGGNAEKEEEKSVEAHASESKDGVKEEEGLVCPETSSWDTNYVFVTPTPIYLSS